MAALALAGVVLLLVVLLLAVVFTFLDVERKLLWVLLSELISPSLRCLALINEAEGEGELEGFVEMKAEETERGKGEVTEAGENPVFAGVEEEREELDDTEDEEDVEGEATAGDVNPNLGAAVETR